MALIVDIPTSSIAIASANGVAGVVYYALQIRQQIKIRYVNFIMRMPSTFTRREFSESWATVGKTESNNNYEAQAKENSQTLI